MKRTTDQTTRTADQGKFQERSHVLPKPVQPRPKPAPPPPPPPQKKPGK